MEPFSYEDAPKDVWGRAVLFAGGGCLLLVLGFALLMTYGTCQCGDSMREGLAARERPLLEPINAFLQASAQGDMGAALLWMDERAQPPYTEDSLRALIDSHQGLFLGGEAVLLRTAPDPEGPGGRLVVVQIMEGEPRRTVRGVATFRLRRAPGLGASNEPRYLIAQLDAGDRAHELRQRQQALGVVQAWLDALSRRQDGQARQLLHPEITQQLDHPSMVQLVDGQAALLRAGARASVQSWQRSDKQAQLAVRLLDEQGQPLGELRCQLLWTEQGWRIASFETQQEVSPP